MLKNLTIDRALLYEVLQALEEVVDREMEQDAVGKLAETIRKKLYAAVLKAEREAMQ